LGWYERAEQDAMRNVSQRRVLAAQQIDNNGKEKAVPNMERRLDRSPARGTNDKSEASELPSPHLSEFEAFLGTMEHNQHKSQGSGKQLANVGNERSEDDDEFPITGRYQRRRKISEGKRDNTQNTVILETQLLHDANEPIVTLPQSMQRPDIVPIVLQNVGAVAAVQRRRRITTLSEGKRHAESNTEIRRPYPCQRSP
jgi:hypothetical protein